MQSSQFILNTEHRKISKDNGKLEADCREITEERLLEMLQNMNYAAIKQIAKGIGIKGKQRKQDGYYNAHKELHKQR